MPSKTTKPAAAKKATAKKASSATKKATKKAPKAKAPEPTPKPEPSSPIDPKAQEAGNQLGDLIEQAAKMMAQVEGVATTKKLAAKLAKGTATNEDLNTLRDGVNGIASALREAKERTLASKFSDANRSVRRAERATRGG